ncbi:Protein ASP-7 [Aphelenchoides avenae]|nr:Protein ASP-7 [Aphelenchus avenae]
MKVIRCGVNNACYRVNVAVGTPPRNFRLTLDNSILYQSMHLFSSKMPAPNSTCKPVDIHRNRFDPSSSTTYVLDGEGQGEGGGKPPYYPYEDPACTKDQFGFSATGFNDSVRFGSVSVRSVPANLINVIQAPLSRDWDADGFLAVRPPDSSSWNAYDTMSVFLSAFERPLMTLYYARVESFDRDADKGGVLTLGGADTTNCDAKWTRLHNDQPPFVWTLMIESFSINGQSIRSWIYNSIDLTTTFITAPQIAVDAVVKATGAEYDFKTDAYQVDCSKRSSFPDMVFKLPAMQYRLPATDYARKVNASDKRCSLMLVAGDYTLTTFWRLGTTFFRPYCSLLDYTAQTLSVAKVLR